MGRIWKELGRGIDQNIVSEKIYFQLKILYLKGNNLPLRKWSFYLVACLYVCVHGSICVM